MNFFCISKVVIISYSPNFLYPSF